MTLVVPISGYASLYDEADLNGDIIAPGAFAKSLKRTGAAGVKLLYQHAAETPVGRWTRFEDRPRGLYAAGELLLATSAVRDVYELARNAIVDGLSIGFRTINAAKAANGRRITEAELWEVSIVTFPMAPKARLTHVGEPQMLAANDHSCHAEPEHAFADAVRRAAQILSV